MHAFMNNTGRHIHYFLLAAFFGIAIDLAGQDIVINEVLSSNRSGVTDEDGDFPDWIEIYNPGAQAVDLGGYGLSDKPLLPFKWSFPSFTINPGEYLFVFASGKDRLTIPRYWETIIKPGDYWKYEIPTSEPSSGWRTNGFDDSGWTSAKASFGYGDGDDSTTVATGTLSIYARKTFEINDPAEISGIALHIDFDDGFVAYLNGHEIGRYLLGIPGVPPAYDLPASDYIHEAQMYQGGAPEVYRADSLIKYLVTGTNVLAIQVHNSSTGSSDLSLIPFLTLGYKHAPQPYTGFPEILNFTPERLHTNFKLGTGDTLALTSSLGAQLDRININTIPANISLGRKPDGSGNWFYFSEPTPQMPNTTQEFDASGDVLPIFSHPGGFVTYPFLLSLSTASGSDSIYYTLNGSDPTLGSKLYTGPINITSTTVVKASVMGFRKLPGEVETKTYVIDASRHLPIVSLSTDSLNLFDDNTGIYALGPNADSVNSPYFGANFWQDWERPVHVEFYDRSGVLQVDQNAGIKIFGSYSRANAQRSLALYARSEYGAKSFKNRLFYDKPIDEFQSFILRNSGNDWNNTMMRDDMMTSLVKNMGIDIMAFRPVTLYINGKYWGMLSMREKINEHFLAENHQVNPYQVDLLEAYGNPVNGDADHYNALLTYITDNSPAVQSKYEYIKTQMDIENYIHYQLSEIYFNNTDWPGNNIKFWRPRTTDGKWRWILYDTDFGFGPWNANDYYNNTLHFALEPNGPGWPNPPWSTLLFRRLILNQEFKYEFINYFADQLNTTFQSAKVVAYINSLQDSIEGEMAEHFQRWGNGSWMSLGQWYNNVEAMRIFGRGRVTEVRKHISTEFGVTQSSSISISVSDAAAGMIRLNSILLETFPWSGIYYKTVPVKITAIPSSGYKFVRWEGISEGEYNSTSTFDPATTTSVKAIFESDITYKPNIVINEINYNSQAEFDAGDWIELYNPGNIAVNLSGWVIKDKDDSHSYMVPQGNILDAGAYLVVCRSIADFTVHYPSVDKAIGDFSFGLGSTVEEVRLYDQAGNLIDMVSFSSTDPWPTEANGTGKTLELNDPGADNALPSNWGSSVIYGTPGKKNSNCITVVDEIPKPAGGNPIGLQSYPNPFSEYTNVVLSMDQAGYARLSVFDIQGRLLDIIHEGNLPRGPHIFTWNGRDASGQHLRGGVYFFRFETKSASEVRRVILLD
jgi:hypothetical protein